MKVEKAKNLQFPTNNTFLNFNKTTKIIILDSE